MQHHTVQQIDRGPRTGKWIYTGGNRRIGRYAECCAEAWQEMLETPEDRRDDSPAWDRIGHDTREGAYEHMRERLLTVLRLDHVYLEWHGCRAPGADGRRCDQPTKFGASIPQALFYEALCPEHLNRETVEAMWNGPGDWYGSW